MSPTGAMWRVVPVKYWRSSLDVSATREAGAHVRVEPVHFLKQLIKRVVSHGGESSESVIGTDIKDITRKERRSAVAIVLRVAGRRKKHEKNGLGLDGSGNVPQKVENRARGRSLEAILEGASGLDILFISRTMYKPRAESKHSQDASQDAQRWSGQVAFPGGKQQGGETDLQTAVRECAEETGLDLNSSAFKLLGKLPSRMATPTLSLSPFVFLQLDQECEPDSGSDRDGRRDVEGGGQQVALQLDKSEVAAAWWVPIEAVASRGEVQTLCLDLRLMGVGSGVAGACRAAGAPALHFPCVPLPPPPPHCITQPMSGQQTVLWGLTLGIVSDLLEAGDVEGAGGELPRPAGALSEARLGGMDGEEGVVTWLLGASGLSFWRLRALWSRLPRLPRLPWPAAPASRSSQ